MFFFFFTKQMNNVTYTVHCAAKNIIVYNQGKRNFFWYMLVLLLSIVQIMNEYILFENMLLTEIYQ